MVFNLLPSVFLVDSNKKLWLLILFAFIKRLFMANQSSIGESVVCSEISVYCNADGFILPPIPWHLSKFYSLQIPCAY